MSNNEEEFIEQIESIVLDNLSGEQFGVSELAETINMNRSNLLLKKSMQLIKQTSLTISEISYQVGDIVKNCIGAKSNHYNIKLMKIKWQHIHLFKLIITSKPKTRF